MAIERGPSNLAPSGVTTFPDLKSVQVSAPNRHSVRPSLVLDFANSRTLDPRITFTRGSNATFYDGTSVLAEQNLIPHSQDFSNTAVWNLNNCTLTTGSVAPDGTNTATKINENTANNIHGVEAGSLMPAASGGYTVSVYAKAAERTWFVLDNTHQTVANYRTWFNLSNGTIGTVASGNTATITNVGNGWYRCTVTRPAGTGGIWRPSFYSATGDNTVSFTGTAGSGVLIWGAQLEQRNAATIYTRTTTAPISNSIPTLKYAGLNQPRFEIDPITEESKGLLIEEQRTNSALNSEEFSTWTLEDVTVISNSNIAPNGTSTADLIVPNTSNTDHTFYRPVTGSGTSTVSIYAKAAGFNYIFIGRNNNTASDGAFFDLVNGTVSQNTSGGTTTIVPVGNGWYRCSLTTTITSYVLFCTSANGTSLSHTGNGYFGVCVWGAQWESGDFSTSYIPTTVSTVTRSPDVAVITGSNFSSWYNPSESTLYGEGYSITGSAAVTAGNAGLVSIDDNTHDNRAILRRNQAAGASNGFNYRLVVNSVSVHDITPTNLPAWTDSLKHETAFAFSGTSQNSAGDGTLSGLTTVPYSSLVNVNQMQIGYGASTAYWNGHISKIAYYPKRLSNAEIVGLTAA